MIKYADHAVGKFFELARQADCFDNTYFLIVADHDIRVFDADLIPIDHYHIPGMILGPGVRPQRVDRVSSQIDLAPTLLGLIRVDEYVPTVGRDLLDTPADDSGRAFMLYYTTNAYRIGDQVVIHQVNRPPAQFVYREGRLEPVDLDRNLARDALAFIDLPQLLCSRRAYALAADEPAPPTTAGIR